MAFPATPLVRIGPPAASALRCGEQAFAAATTQRAVTEQAALVWLVAGTGALLLPGGRVRPLAAGDAIRRFPGRALTVRFDAGACTLFAALPAGAAEALQELGCPGIDRPVLAIGRDRELERRWRSVAAAVAATPRGRLAALAGRVLDLIAEAHRRALAPGDGDAALLERAAAMLADVQSARRRIAAVARAVGMTERSFRRRFARWAGLPPEGYRIGCRLQAAQDLLRATGLPLGAIADRLGYRDLADFSRQFRRGAGRSPSAWRREAIAG